MSKIESEIKQKIKDNKIMMFSKTFCPFCKKVKAIFAELEVQYTAFELDLIDNGTEYQDELGKITGARSVPRVFINGKFIGGASDVEALHKKGELIEIINQQS